MLERFVLFLHYSQQRGDVMVEGRGGEEDEKLKESYQRLYLNGTDHVLAERWQERLTSRELKVKPKTADIAGLQLADLIAHPSRREFLLENRLIADERDTFGDRICAILRGSKYLRARNGQIYGYGKKLNANKCQTSLETTGNRLMPHDLIDNRSEPPCAAFKSIVAQSVPPTR